ncbi:MAG: esterase/lipase family protein [Longimicrobiaceae bacterium]
MNERIRLMTRAAGSRFAATMCGILAALATASATAAQEQPVEFNHGFSNQGTAWVPTANYLEDLLQIDIRTPETTWHASFDDQSAELRSDLNAWGRNSIIGLAHSNGGLVARNYVQRNDYSSRIDRLATIGTPHLGATIAANVINGRVFNYFGGMAASIFGALSFYEANDPDWYTDPVISYALQFSFGAMQYLGYALASNSSLVGLGFGYSLPVTQQDVPGSTFLSQLNSPGGLNTESAILTRKVGISTQVIPNYALLSVISSDPGTWAIIRVIAKYGALALYFHYREHPDYWLQAHAGDWLTVAWYLHLMPVAWHDFIGAVQGFDGFNVYIYPSDGMIPHWSTEYPDAYRQINMDLPTFHISHTQQKDHPAARQEFKDVLIGDFDVLQRTDEPPPEPEPCVPPPGKFICDPEPY